MTLEAWAVIALPVAPTSVSEWPKTVRRLQHLGTTVYVDAEAGGLRYGQVVWGAEVESQLAGIAWDWCEVRSNIVALSDPMTVHSNVVLFDDAGKPINESSKLLFLSRAINSLPWQAQISAQPPDLQSKAA